MYWLEVFYPNDAQVSIYTPGGTWWARCHHLNNGAELWELFDGENNPAGVYDSADDAIGHVEAEYDMEAVEV